MGGGTTGVACKLQGRDFIGIEISKMSFKIAKERIETTKESNKECTDYAQKIEKQQNGMN